MWSSYYMNGPISLFVVIFGSFLNGLTIYFLFFYALSKRLNSNNYISGSSTIRLNNTTPSLNHSNIKKFTFNKNYNKASEISSNYKIFTKNNYRHKKSPHSEIISTVKLNASFEKYSLVNHSSLQSSNSVNNLNPNLKYSEIDSQIRKSSLTTTKKYCLNRNTIPANYNKEEISNEKSSQIIDSSNNPTVSSFILALLKLTTQNPMLNGQQINYLNSKKSNNIINSIPPTKQPAHNMGRPRVYTFFLWLVISDTTLLICALLMYSIPTLFNGNIGFYVYFTPFFYLMSNTALTASVWLMCALIFDRYRTIVVHPFVKKYNIENKPTNRIHQVLLLVYILALSFSLPRFFELRLQWDPTTNEYFLMQTSIVHNKIYMIGYRILGGIFLYSLFPYVVLFVLSFRVRDFKFFKYFIL